MRRPLRLREVLNLEATSGAFSPIATFAGGHSYDLGDETLHGQANALMFAGYGRQGTSEATDDVSTVSLDMHHRAKLLVQHVADGRDSRPEVTARSFSTPQLVSEFFSDLSKHRLQLNRRETIREDIHYLPQQRNVGVGQELFRLRCQLEYVRRSGCAGSLASSPHDAIAFKPRDLRTNCASGELQLSGDAIGCQPAAAKEGHDATAA